MSLLVSCAASVCTVIGSICATCNIYGSLSSKAVALIKPTEPSLKRSSRGLVNETDSPLISLWQHDTAEMLEAGGAHEFEKVRVGEGKEYWWNDSVLEHSKREGGGQKKRVVRRQRKWQSFDHGHQYPVARAGKLLHHFCFIRAWYELNGDWVFPGWIIPLAVSHTHAEGFSNSYSVLSRPCLFNELYLLSPI